MWLDLAGGRNLVDLSGGSSRVCMSVADSGGKKSNPSMYRGLGCSVEVVGCVRRDWKARTHWLMETGRWRTENGYVSGVKFTNAHIQAPLLSYSLWKERFVAGKN